ncbi:MAG: hypothetical protein BJG00_018690 [Limnothrix sp. CACIAM 69d]|nr:MAG: hypothetical protein BJG00_018690 [Limnothrix sp. CACIAM 69d]
MVMIPALLWPLNIADFPVQAIVGKVTLRVSSTDTDKGLKPLAPTTAHDCPLPKDMLQISFQNKGFKDFWPIAGRSQGSKNSP